MALVCRWHGEFRNCSHMFKVSKTDDGFCCSFNTVSLSEGFKPPDLSSGEPGPGQDEDGGKHYDDYSEEFLPPPEFYDYTEDGKLYKLKKLIDMSEAHIQGQEPQLQRKTLTMPAETVVRLMMMEEGAEQEGAEQEDRLRTRNLGMSPLY